MKKHFLYLSYILRHKWFVFVAGLKTGAPVWRLLIHDWSKFMPCEWLPYARYFYGKKPSTVSLDNWREQKAWQEVFDHAWLHHQHFNPHHWQHWILREDSGVTKRLPMPEHIAREMVADWMGAGRAITGKWGGTSHWYVRNLNNIALHSDTRNFVENLLADIEDSHDLIEPLSVKSAQ